MSLPEGATIDRMGQIQESGAARFDCHTLLDRLQNYGGGLEGLERALLHEAVDRANGNLSAAARLLGITRPQLSYRLGRKQNQEDQA